MHNEIDPKAAAWLRQLIADGHLDRDIVNDCSIENLEPKDCPGTSHFFAGIGGWAHALKLASWPANLPVWTGSCPCQPFSKSGKREGTSDERHLWPAWLNLIAECMPSVIFGEQVASELGRSWFSVVRDDLEALGYAVGCADISAASVGAPHRRQRLFFGASRLSHSREIKRIWNLSRMGNSHKEGPQGRTSADNSHKGSAWSPGMVDWIKCTDGIGRPSESGTYPLVDGVPARVVRIGGYGNAIVPQVGAVFIKSFMEAL